MVAVMRGWAGSHPVRIMISNPITRMPGFHNGRVDRTQDSQPFDPGSIPGPGKLFTSHFSLVLINRFGNRKAVPGGCPRLLRGPGKRLAGRERTLVRWRGRLPPA